MNIVSALDAGQMHLLGVILRGAINSNTKINVDNFYNMTMLFF